MKERQEGCMDKTFKRGAGILMPISSIPSPYGIGTFGKAAYEFADKLERARQSYWQVLPLGPTSYGDSPYASFSAFAGNPYFIDLDKLAEEGLVTHDEICRYKWSYEEDKVDYSTIYDNRFKVLRTAFKNSNCLESEGYKTFVKNNKFWLDNYALFMAVKNEFNNVSWTKWDRDIKFRTPAGIRKYKKLLAEDINFWKFIQYLFFKQWNELKNYVNSKGIEIIGDIPIYVALDSADVWANPKVFLLDSGLRPKKVAGVPPDVFSETGQLWGNPLYDWKALEEDNFGWWRKRMKHSAMLYDVIRIDHFLGIVKYYAIPRNAKDAKKGVYKKGPGMKLIKAIDEAVGNKKIIAEDLGVLIPEAVKVLDESGYPGMKVMEFAFDGSRDNSHLPIYWKKNLVAYGGTHDNDTVMGWVESASEEALALAMKTLEFTKKEEAPDAFIRFLFHGPCDTVIFPAATGSGE